MGKRKRTVQDDSREKQLAALCGLQYVETREGPDAVDRDGNLYELKSTTRSGVSTARDVGPHTIREWRNKYWIFAVGEYYESGFDIESLYIAHPQFLEDRFSQIESQILSRYEPCMKVLDAARRAGVSPEVLKIAEAVIERGVTLNNPKIPVWFIQQRAHRLDHQAPEILQKQLKEYVIQHPLITPSEE